MQRVSAARGLVCTSFWGQPVHVLCMGCGQRSAPSIQCVSVAKRATNCARSAVVRRFAVLSNAHCARTMQQAFSRARMRQIILDTETTGLYPEQGHKIIELAAVEVVDRRPTGRTLHFYLDPEREIDSGATEVHGMTWDDLKGRPRFRDVAPEFLDFARGAEWIIHNAPFDVAFLDYELSLAGLPCCATNYGKVVDTLA